MSDMLRKEAIDWLCRLRSWIAIYIPRNKQKCKQALDFAIKSLETDEAYKLVYEKPELCEDYISRKEAISWIENLRTLNEHYHPNAKDNNLIDCDSAIDHLKQVPSVLPKQPEFCEDCISKSDALDSINWAYNLSDAYEKINMLPSVLPKVKWIPVSEKLPHDRDWYLGIFKEPDTNWINTLPFICDYVGRETKETTKEYWILRGFTDRDEHIDYYFNLECVAWMPLPQAYREGGRK